MKLPDLSTLPDSMTCALPDAAIEASESGGGGGVEPMGDNFVSLDGKRLFIRCRLPLVTQIPSSAFAYHCWAEVSREGFEVTRRLWNEPTTRGMIKVEGKLANALPPFEEAFGSGLTLAVPDWKAPALQVVAVASPELAPYTKPPGADPQAHLAILSEVLRENFALEVEEKFRAVWGEPVAYEDFESKEWRTAPRRVVIAELEPAAEGEPWHYATVGLSSRPMSQGDRVEFAWESTRRITGDDVFAAMARIAAMPWRMRVDFSDGYIITVPGGFPPGTEFRYALCYDAARTYSALRDLTVFDQKVKVIMPLPIQERDKASLRKDETKFLNLKDFLR